MRQVNSASPSSRHKLFIGLLALMFSILGANFSAANAQEYNARNEFSLTQGGTTGVWNYGYSTSDLDNTLNLFSQATDTTSSVGCNGGIFEIWRIDNAVPIPQIARHTTPIFCDNVPGNALFIHPGFNNQRAVVRWTAPTAGTFQIIGTLQKQNVSATSDLKIIKNAATAGEIVLFTGEIGAASQTAFNFTATVAIGDKLDFSVGDADNSQISDGSSISITIGQPATACQTPPANLQVNVPAENSPIDVQSVNTNASLVGDATYTNMGKVGRAFNFDGAGDYVRIEDNPAQRPANALTLEGWFKFNGSPGTTILVSKPLGAGTDNSFALFTDGGILKAVAQNVVLSTSYSPSINQWNHFAYTFDDATDTHKLFANGVEIASSAITASITYDNSPLLIGAERDNGVFAFFLNGQADEVSVYGRALSQTEIFNLTKQGSFGKCSPANCAESQQGLVSWFRGEGNALDAKGGNNGTLQNGAAFSTGRVGQAFDFPNGNAHVSIPDSPSLRPTNFTVEGWFNFSSYANEYRQLIGKKSADPSYSSYAIYIYGGLLTATATDGINVGNSLNYVLAPVPGQWYHIAFTRQSGGTQTLYVNGVAVNSNASNPAIGYAATPLTIGDGGGSSILGKVDELSIFNRVLSQTEVQSIFYAGQNGKCTSTPCVQSPNNLVSWFAGEQNALDSRSNNHGNFEGGPSYVAGKVGQAFSFNGSSQRVALGNPADLQLQDFTIDAWVKRDSATVVSNNGAGSGQLGAFVAYGTNGYGFGIKPDGTILLTKVGVSGSDSLGTKITDTNWHHVAVTKLGGNVTFYVDGVAASGTAGPYNPGFTFGSNVFIGYFGSGGGEFLGKMDEVDIFNRELTASEVQSIYNSGQSGKCKPSPLNPTANQVAWLTGDGDARDFAGEDDNGIINGATFRVGKVGQAFHFDGAGSSVKIPASSSLDVGTASGMTIETWIRPNNTSASQILVEWSSASEIGAHIALSANFSGPVPGNISANIIDTGGTNHLIETPGGLTMANTYQHIAVTYDKTTGIANLFLNGAVVATQNLGIFTPRTNSDLYLGKRILGGNPFAYSGGMDETSIYNRTLTASEIAAIYNAGVAGKLKEKPTAVNLLRNAKTAANLLPTTIQLSDATVTFAQVTTAGTTSQSNMDLGSLPKLPRGATFTGLAYDISTTAAYQSGSANDLRVCFNVPALQNSTFADLRILHLESGVWFDRTATGNVSPNLCANNLPSLSPFVIVQIAPTSADVSVTGKVTNVFGNGLRNVNVTITDSRGSAVHTKTNSFGNYRFEEVSAGELYVVGISSKRYTFAISSQLISVQEAVENVDFMANEVNESRKPNR